MIRRNSRARLEHTGFEDDDSFEAEVEMTFIVGETGAGRITMCGSANYGAAMALPPWAVEKERTPFFIVVRRHA